MIPWRRVRLYGFVLSCIIVTSYLVKYQISLNRPLKVQSQSKPLESSSALEQTTFTLNQSDRKPNQSKPQLNPSPLNRNQTSAKLDQSKPKLKENQSSLNLKKISKKEHQSLETKKAPLAKFDKPLQKLKQTTKNVVRIFNRSDIKAARDIFPKGSRPPDSLHSDFIIENADLCSGVLCLEYIIVIHSATYNFEHRQSMRLTWTKQNLFKNTNSQRIFLLGKTLNSTLQGKIIEENKEYGDIVQGDFIDHYRNLTLKAVMGLKWIVKNCRHADYVIKVDDDVFVNIFQVKKTIFPLLNSTPMQVVCSVDLYNNILRNPNAYKGKWTISAKYFKEQKHYPMPFCFGYATFYTTVLATELLNMAYSTPFYRLDDVYVYGILMSKIKSASWRDEGKRYFKVETTALKNFSRKSEALVGTARSNRSMQILWRSVS